jgi:hypothetical protein
MYKKRTWLILIVVLVVIVAAVALGRDALWNFLLALHGKH